MTGPVARLFDADGHDRWVDLTDKVAGSLGPKRLLWVDVDRTSDDADSTLAAVEEVLGVKVTDLTVNDEDAGRARLVRREDRIHLTVEALEPEGDDASDLVRREIDLIAGPNLVVSIHAGDSAALARFRKGLEARRAWAC